MNAIPVWAMLATPFTDDGAQVDHGSLVRYCEEVTARGCAAVVVLGVIGEPAALSLEERIAVIATALDTVAEVYVGVMGATAAERSADLAAVAGAFGDQVAGYLVPITTADPTALRVEVETLHGIGRRPIVLQDYPAASGTSIAVDDLARAVVRIHGVAAIKCEAPTTFARIRRLRELLPDVALMSGLGGLSLVDDLSQGAQVVAAGTSRPEAAVAVVRAWCDGDEATARRLVAGSAAAAGFEIQQGTSIAIRKEHWRRQGVIRSAAVRAPLAAYEPWLSPLSDAHGFRAGVVAPSVPSHGSSIHPPHEGEADG